MPKPLTVSVQFSHSVVSDSSRPHGPQYAKPPCPSPTPGVYSKSSPLSWCCHPTISSSVIPFSSSLQYFPASGSFQMNQLFALGLQDHNKLWKILQEIGIPGHLTYLLWNLYAGQEAIVRTGHGTTDWFQIGKGVCQGCILSPRLFNLYAEYIMRNSRLDEAQAVIKILWEIKMPSDMQMTPPLWQKVKN